MDSYKILNDKGRLMNEKNELADILFTEPRKSNNKKVLALAIGTLSVLFILIVTVANSINNENITNKKECTCTE